MSKGENIDNKSCSEVPSTSRTDKNVEKVHTTGLQDT